MDNPKVSIIVPVYNVEKYLRCCIDSILTQTFTEFECILIDDCSLDSSPQICDEYGAKDARVKVIHHETNMGNNCARKTGIVAAAPYIQCVDSDDWIEPEMTERLYLRALKEKLDIVMCDFISYRANGQKCFPFFSDVRGMDKEAILKSLLTDNLSWSLWNKLYAKKLFDGIKFAPYRSFEDVVVIVQLFLNAETFGYECSSLYHWRFNPTSIGNSRKREHINWVEGYKNTQIIKDILIERGYTIPMSANTNKDCALLECGKIDH
jgi:glycosyltransferase involved in cell wall biosynthesis